MPWRPLLGLLLAGVAGLLLGLAIGSDGWSPPWRGDAGLGEIVFDIRLSALVKGVDNQIVDRPRLAA